MANLIDATRADAYVANVGGSSAAVDDVTVSDDYIHCLSSWAPDVPIQNVPVKECR